LFIDAPDGTQAMQGLSPQEQGDLVRWLFAEAYAAGARFHVPYPSLDYYAPLDDCQQYTSFIRDNAGIYTEARHVANVGLLFSYASQIWDYWGEGSGSEPSHNRQWYGLAQALTDMSIQYDAVFAPDGTIIPDDLTLDYLLAYDTMIVPWTYALSEEHVSLLGSYAESGQDLILVGGFATHDREKNPRPGNPASDLRGLGATVVPSLDFESYLSDPLGHQAAAIRDALADLFPDRRVRISNSSVTAHLTRVGDTLYCHLVNRDLRDSGFEPQTDVQVSINLPGDLVLSGRQALYITPDEAGANQTGLPLANDDGQVSLTVPRLDLYGVLVIPDSGY
jgi:hypothetical protein